MHFEHDNHKSHLANIVKEKIVEFGLDLLPHPPYSPGIAPSDYGSLSNRLKNRKFKNEDELKRYFQEFFDSKPEEFYDSGICDLPRRWAKVIDTNREYKLD